MCKTKLFTCTSWRADNWPWCRICERLRNVRCRWSSRSAGQGFSRSSECRRDTSLPVVCSPLRPDNTVVRITHPSQPGTRCSCHSSNKRRAKSRSATYCHHLDYRIKVACKRVEKIITTWNDNYKDIKRIFQYLDIFHNFWKIFN